MTPSEPTKQRALRIDLHHHKQREPLAKWKLVLAIVAAVASAAYAGYLCVPGSPGEAQVAPGNVAAVHMAWNNRCIECHQNWKAIHGDAWALEKETFDRDTQTWSVDKACLACHAAPHHHEFVSSIQVETCGSCHQDHQGFNASLVRMDDQHCTRCHDDLGEAKAGTNFKPVSAFATEHPEFRSLQGKDPGNVEFSHEIHMSLGMSRTVDGVTLKNYEDVAAVDASYLKRAVPGYTEGGTGPVQLACASCHEPLAINNRTAFSTENGGSESDPQSQSGHFAPIKYDRHCAACHQLTIDEVKNENKAGSDDIQVKPKPDLASDRVPHGLVRHELEQAILGLMQKRGGKPEGGVREQYERLLGKPKNELVAEEIAKATTDLEQKRRLTDLACKKCHAGQDPFSEAGITARIPAMFLQHARFNHSPHRDMNCLQCHPQARGHTVGPEVAKSQAGLFDVEKYAQPSTKSSDIMITNYDSCVQCHRPIASSPPNKIFGTVMHGVRSDCAECHTYHGRELGGFSASAKVPGTRDSGSETARSDE